MERAEPWGEPPAYPGVPRQWPVAGVGVPAALARLLAHWQPAHVRARQETEDDSNGAAWKSPPGCRPGCDSAPPSAKPRVATAVRLPTVSWP